MSKSIKGAVLKHYAEISALGLDDKAVIKGRLDVSYYTLWNGHTFSKVAVRYSRILADVENQIFQHTGHRERLDDEAPE